MSSQKNKKEINVLSTKSYISRNKLTKENKIYIIHDNGGRPYKVFINKNNLKVYGMYYDQQYKSMKETRYEKLIKDITIFEGYWYGLNNGFGGEKYNGNSILVKIKDDTYMFVGWKIFKFKTTVSEKILDYISPIGNSDVPYPLAIGNKYVYFMLEEKKVSINKFKTKFNINHSDLLYVEYYNRRYIDLEPEPFRNLKMIMDRF